MSMKSKGYWKRMLAHMLCVCMIVLTVCGTNISIVQATEVTDESSVENMTDILSVSEMEESDEAEEDSEEEEVSETETTSEEQESTVAETSEQENELMLLAKEEVPKAAEVTNIYFLNSKGWEEVGAYVYGDKGEILGGWGSTKAESADELGGDWLKVSVSEVPPYSIIFFNKAADSERAELYLETEEHIYVTVDAKAYTSQAEAEATVKGDETPEKPTEPEKATIYFLNSEEWSEVGGYIYGDKGDLLGGWPGTIAEPAEELGKNWVKIEVNDAPR